jgi:hypothetical protein
VFLNAEWTELERDLAELQGAIDAADPGGIAHQRLIILKARLKYGIRSGLKKPVVAADAANSSLVQVDAQSRSLIGSIVNREGKLFRVTAEDANFVATAGDRVDKNGVRIPDDSPLDFVAEIPE